VEAVARFAGMLRAALGLRGSVLSVWEGISVDASVEERGCGPVVDR
jgi:hypothetical protein